MHKVVWKLKTQQVFIEHDQIKREVADSVFEEELVLVK